MSTQGLIDETVLGELVKARGGEMNDTGPRSRAHATVRSWAVVSSASAAVPAQSHHNLLRLQTQHLGEQSTCENVPLKV